MTTRIAGQVTIRSLATGVSNSTRQARVIAAVTSRFTEERVKDVKELTRALNELSDNLNEVTLLARSNPSLSSVVIRDITMTASAYTLEHRLDRPYQGWRCVRARTAAWNRYEVSLASGQTSDRFIAFSAGTAGLYDIEVW